MFTTLDARKTDELYLVRRSWFSPEYELTDNANCYGRIKYHRLSGRKATATAANETWIFKREAAFSRTLLTTDQNDALIAEATRDWLGRRIILILQTGFRAEFYRPSMWSRNSVWTSGDHGDIMHFTSNCFSLTDTIHIDQSTAPKQLIPLLTFLGGYLVILRRLRSARH
ncbi:MAG: hypothetical protein JWP37_22 [Mucilaginibacter sp.]|nr:hypothetical protein [Mucilaginibacter sp.]